jgi:hypothetical protein
MTLASEPEDDEWEEIEAEVAKDIAQQVYKMAVDRSAFDKDGTEMINAGVVGNIVENVIVELVRMLRDLDRRIEDA